jgi:hypothetical protein
MLRRNGVADSRQHIGNGISHEKTPVIFDCQFSIVDLKSTIGNRKSKMFYQLDLTTPGICPWSANSRKQMRHRLNFRR